MTTYKKKKHNLKIINTITAELFAEIAIMLQSLQLELHRYAQFQLQLQFNCNCNYKLHHLQLTLTKGLLVMQDQALLQILLANEQ